MKKFEYKNFHERPLLKLDATQFADFIMKVLNEKGQEGWEAIQVTTPQVGQQLTGDLLILAKRELEPVDVTGLEIGLIRAFRPWIEKFLKEREVV